MTRKIAVLATVLAGALQAAPAHAVVPQVMTYSGYLRTSGGSAVTTPTSLSFRLYTTPAGGTPVWAESLSATPSSDGWFSVVLGTTAALPFASLGGELYLGIEVATEGEFPQRARLTPSYAAISVDWGGVANRPAACTAGQFLSGYDAAGAALCATPPGGGTGGVSAVVGSAPISATGTGAVTVSLTGCPSANQILEWSGTTWRCIATPTPVGGGVSQVQVQQPLINTGTATAPNLGLTNTCVNGQVLKWNSGTNTWGCANDLDTNSGGTVVSISATGPLGVTGAGTTPNIVISQANGTTPGYLSSADWNTFNNKVGTVLVTAPLGASSGGGTASIGLSGCSQAGQELMWNGTSWVCSDFGLPLQVLGRTSTAPVLFMSQANATTDGWLAAGDYGRFAAKLSGIAPGAGIQVDPTIDPLNPTVSVAFPASGARGGTATQAARADHDHGRSKLVASFANTSDSITGGSVNRGDGALVITTSPGVASVVEIKNVSSSFALGTASAGSSLAFKANASFLNHASHIAYVFFGGVIGIGNQTGGYGFKFQGDGAGGRTVTVMTMRSGGTINTLSLPSPLPAGLFSFYAVHRGATVDFYIDGGLFSSLSAVGMATDVFQAYTVRMEQAASANSGTFALSFLTLEIQAL